MEYYGKQVTIMACSDCNANCEHCYISYTGGLSGKELLEMCSVLRNKHKIIINGTEVLLHDDYFDALAISDQSRVLTNGIIIHNNPELLNKIKSVGINAIAMSYHFDSDVSSVSQKMVEENIKQIQEVGLNAELMCTITSENYNRLEQICDRTIQLGVHTIRLFNCLNTGNCETNENNICLSEDQLLVFFEQLRLLREKYPKSVLKIKRNGGFGKDIKNCDCHFKCTAGVDEVVITPNSKVYPCIFMAKDGFEIGDYVDGKIILHSIVENADNQCIAYNIYNKNMENTYIKKLKK